jgi:hypothetical protein
MSTKTSLLLATAGLFAALALPVSANTVSMGKNNPGSVQKGCSASGDLYFPPNENGVFGCIKAGGNGVVCGGVGKFAKTCSTFAKPQTRGHLPTQAQVSKKGTTLQAK